MSKETNQNKVTNPLKQYARYTGIAFQMMAVMALSAWLGWKLDQWMELSFPIFTLVLTIATVALVLYKIIRSLSN
jgi:F0F1-type ATP synthase assembly protein I